MMRRAILCFFLVLASFNVVAQQPPADLAKALDDAQQRARYTRDQMKSTEDKVKAADKKNNAALKRVEEQQKRLDDAKAQADQTAKQLQDTQAELAKAREAHDQAYKDLGAAHDAFEKAKPQ
jgi:predicted  nucleic acid-binding Zn-ribbon protein